MKSEQRFSNCRLWSISKTVDCDLLVSHDNNLNVYNQHLTTEKIKILKYKMINLWNLYLRKYIYIYINTHIYRYVMHANMFIGLHHTVHILTVGWKCYKSC